MGEKEKQVELVIQELYDNNQSKLRQLCNKEMLKFGGLSPKDYDDFYSRAGQEIAMAYRHGKYDPSKSNSPMEFFCGVIRKAVWKEMTVRNRGKRQVTIEKEEEDTDGNIIKKKEYIPTISLETPLGDDESITIGDILQSDFDIDKMLYQDIIEEEYSSEMERYLGRLSKIQIRVLKLIADDYTPDEIKKILNINHNLYADCISAIRSYNNTKYIAGLVNTRRYKHVR